MQALFEEYIQYVSVRKMNLPSGLRRKLEDWSDDLDDPDEMVYRPFNGSGEIVAYRGGLMLTYKIPTFATKNNLDE